MEAAAAQGFEGRRLGRYLLRYRVAQGGMAAVYLAQLAGAHSFAKWVAVKVIHPHLAEDRRFVDMFLDEANLASRIHHPNACAVTDFGVEDGLPFIVMEYLHGETMSAVMRSAWKRDGMPVWLAARITADAARGLHAAHQMRGRDGEPLGLVHRDVSPQNIMVLYDGVSKIMDFGIARATGRVTSTRAGEVKGKYGYMSPEQLRGADVDARTDVWALGVVLWESTVGRRLFRGESEGETIARVMSDAIPRPSTLRSDYPAALEKVVLSALERDPAARAQTAAEVADGLDAFLYGYGRVVGTAQVASWMGEHLRERRAKRESMLFAPGPIEAGEIADVDLHSQSTLGSKVGGEYLDVSAQSHAARRERRSAWVFGVLGILLGVGAVAAAHLVMREDAPVESAAEPRADTALSTPTSGATATETPTPTAAETETAEDTDTATAARTETATATATGTAEGSAATDLASGTTDDGSRSTSRTARTAEDDDRRAAAQRTPRSRRRAAPSAAGAESPAPAQPAEPGRLNLLALPAAEVFLGARSLGTTPLLGVELPAGQHSLRLRAVGGDAEKTVRVVIRPGEQTRTSVSLR